MTNSVVLKLTVQPSPRQQWACYYTNRIGKSIHATQNLPEVDCITFLLQASWSTTWISQPELGWSHIRVSYSKVKPDTFPKRRLRQTHLSSDPDNRLHSQPQVPSIWITLNLKAALGVKNCQAEYWGTDPLRFEAGVSRHELRGDDNLQQKR